MDIQTRIQKLSAANTNNTPPEGGLFLENALQQVQLDYTPDSLKRIDALLNQIREKLKPVEEGFLADIAKENFALTLASYLGNYLCKETKSNALWFTYQDAVKQFPPEPKLPQGFTTHLIAIIENTVVMPMAALLRIFDDKSHTVEYFFNGVLKLIKNNQAIAEGWKQEYLNDFLAEKAIPGEIAFEQALKELKLDFSLESLDVIDGLLIAIKQQTQPDYARWMGSSSLCNFLYLLGTYLGATTALNANCFVKWLSYEQTKAMHPTTPHTFGTSFNAMFGGGTLMYPVGKVCDLLFADDNNINCRGFAERVMMDKETPSMIHLYPNMQAAQQNASGFFSKFKSKPTFDPKWGEPFREAGFLAAFAASGLAGNSQLSPQMLQGAKPDRKKVIIDFSFYENWEKANQTASDYMEGNAEKVPFQVYIFDGYANLPLERLDAMYIDIRYYDAPKMSCLLIVPYRQASSPEGFKIYTPKLCNSTIPEEQAANAANAFFAGARNFVGLNWDNANWDKYFEEM
ncbi:MAG: hypothetical protein PHI11_02135 [Gallionella sp.]|nr:hypothetical protein [Gallionella sp.]